MASFLTALDIRVLDDCGPRPQVMLLSDLEYESGIAGIVTVPTGFVCDMASIPSGLIGGLAAAGGITPTTGMRAAVVHDYLVGRTDFDRHTADRVFHEALTRACGVDQAAADMMFTAVAAYTHLITSQPDNNPPVGA